ncbi:hypothetical protein [Ethanoligenens sp.]|uniref:hypothetical protein n=1 Tax=Ethanoligenens sp. TaxID=2099655 RepID=UPI0039E94E70
MNNFVHQDDAQPPRLWGVRKIAAAHFTGGLGVPLNKQIADVCTHIHCLPKLQTTKVGSAHTAGRGRNRASSSCGATAPRTE